MAARKEFPVKVRRVAVTNKKTGVKYIEERRYQYDPAKGYNVLLSSRRTGEKILEGETVTTRCRPKKKPAEAAQTAELSAKPKSRSKPSRYSSENDVLIEKSVKYTDFFLLSIVYV